MTARRVVDDMVREAVVFGVVVAASLVVVIVAFDWPPGRTAARGAVPMVVWGAFSFVIGTMRKVAGEDLERTPPAHLALEPGGPSRRRTALGLLVGIPLYVGLAWLMNLWELGGAVVLGQLAGSAAAAAIGAVVARRWEHRHQAVLLAVRDDKGDDRLYAIAATDHDPRRAGRAWS